MVGTLVTETEHEDSCPSSTNIVVILSQNFCSNFLDQKKTPNFNLTLPRQVQTLATKGVSLVICLLATILHLTPLCKQYCSVQKYIIQ